MEHLLGAHAAMSAVMSNECLMAVGCTVPAVPGSWAKGVRARTWEGFVEERPWVAG